MTAIPTLDLVDALNTEYADKYPTEILELALNQEGEIAISFSGAEDVVLIDMASRLRKPFRVFSPIQAVCILKLISLSKRFVSITISRSKSVFQNRMRYSSW